MSILWCGGQDIDFPNGTAVSVSTSSTYHRSGWSMCGVYQSASGNVVSKSTLFPSGAVTSAWVTFRFTLSYTPGTGTGQVNIVDTGFAGFGLSGTNSGLFFGVGSTATSPALLKYDGTTWTVLATGTQQTFAANTSVRIDMQVSGYGASATVNVYWNGIFAFAYTGDVTVPGMTSFNSVFIPSVSHPVVLVEMVVSDSDTRVLMGLSTQQVVTWQFSQGGTNPPAMATEWFGSYPGLLDVRDVQPDATIPATPVITSTLSGEDEHLLLLGLNNVFAVASTKIAIAASGSPASGFAVTGMYLGYSEGGAIGFPGPAQAVTSGLSILESYDTNNPVTGLPWLPSDFAPATTVPVLDMPPYAVTQLAIRSS